MLYHQQLRDAVYRKLGGNKNKPFHTGGQFMCGQSTPVRSLWKHYQWVWGWGLLFAGFIRTFTERKQFCWHMTNTHAQWRWTWVDWVRTSWITHELSTTSNRGMSTEWSQSQTGGINISRSDTRTRTLLGRWQSAGWWHGTPTENAIWSLATIKY